jgi:hypothetical protein
VSINSLEWETLAERLLGLPFPTGGLVERNLQILYDTSAGLSELSGRTTGSRHTATVQTHHVRA